MVRYLIIALLGLILIYISTEIFQEPNLLTAIGFIIGLCMVLGGTFVMRIKWLDETLNNKKRQTETEI